MKKIISNLLKEHSVSDIILGIIFYTVMALVGGFAYYTLISLAPYL